MSKVPEEVLIQYRVTTKGWIHVYCIEADIGYQYSHGPSQYRQYQD